MALVSLLSFHHSIRRQYRSPSMVCLWNCIEFPIDFPSIRSILDSNWLICVFFSFALLAPDVYRIISPTFNQLFSGQAKHTTHHSLGLLFLLFIVDQISDYYEVAHEYMVRREMKETWQDAHNFAQFHVEISRQAECGDWRRLIIPHQPKRQQIIQFSFLISIAQVFLWTICLNAFAAFSGSPFTTQLSSLSVST